VRGKPAATVPAVIKPTSPNSFTAVDRKGTEWAGIQLLSSGVYTINMTTLGAAKAALGDTRGEDLMANLRLTLGKDIMKETEHSYSLAGLRQYQPTTGELRYLWHISQSEPMTVDKPVVVTVKKDEVLLTQEGLQFAKFPRASKPVLLAFKNVLLNVNFEELPTAPQTPLPTAARVAFTNAWGIQTTKRESVFAKLAAED